ncbi:FkbM family methyltransferase [Mycobacterium sp.]|uniref:FkbM family methyltransferase n=1 Tax=Mycobacterium sp. TaxID=1785 RepID=UPI003C765256
MLSASRLTHVVDVGANPLDGGKPPYLPMLKAGLCHVTGFEPQQQAFLALLLKRGPNELYLPCAVGDGRSHTLKVCRATGMTSLLEPDPTTLGLFPSLQSHGEVIERVPTETRRLDDISEIEHVDLLKIDVQGSELPVFQNGQQKLAEAVAIQTEVSFITLYLNQPSFGEVDSELRGQGFIPHCFAEVSRRPIGDFEVDALPWVNQLTEADIVYVRDFSEPDVMTDEQLKQLGLIAHHCYRSVDLAFRCVALLEERRAVEAGSAQRYRSLSRS